MTDFSLPLPRPRASGSTRASGSNRTLRGTLRAQFCVLHAVMLHDIKSRFFGNGLGYVVTILWPGAHIAIIVIAHAVVHREMPYGDSPFLYAATGVMPYIAFNYISRFTMTGVMQNSSYLQYPIIKVMDLMIARQILQIVTCTIVTIGLILVLMLCQVDAMPVHPDQAALGLLSAVLLGIGFGILNGCICIVFPLWNLGYILILISFYFTSGVILNPETMPASIGKLFAWNPLLHCVEWLRSGYYDDYPTHLLDKVYVIYVALGSLVLGLLMERVIRYFR